MTVSPAHALTNMLHQHTPSTRLLPPTRCSYARLFWTPDQDRWENLRERNENLSFVSDSVGVMATAEEGKHRVTEVTESERSEEVEEKLCGVFPSGLYALVFRMPKQNPWRASRAKSAENRAWLGPRRHFSSAAAFAAIDQTSASSA